MPRRHRPPFVMWQGRIVSQAAFAPPLDPAPGACNICGGMGYTEEQIDEERLPEMWPCWACKQVKEDKAVIPQPQAVEAPSGQPAGHRAHTTGTPYKGRPLMVRIHPRYLEVWRKGKRDKYTVPYDAIYDLAQKLGVR